MASELMERNETLRHQPVPERPTEEEDEEKDRTETTNHPAKPPAQYSPLNPQPSSRPTNNASSLSFKARRRRAFGSPTDTANETADEHGGTETIKVDPNDGAGIDNVVDGLNHNDNNDEDVTLFASLEMEETMLENDDFEDQQDEPATKHGNGQDHENDDDHDDKSDNENDDNSKDDDESNQNHDDDDDDESAVAPLKGRTKKTRQELAACAAAAAATQARSFSESKEDDNEDLELDTQHLDAHDELKVNTAAATTTNANKNQETTQAMRSPPKKVSENEHPVPGGFQSRPAPPETESILASTDDLFAQVTDKNTVTVKDILTSLEAEYDCQLDKSVKALVKKRLMQLIQEQVVQQAATTAASASSSSSSVHNDEPVSDVGEAEESSSSDDDDDEREPDEEASDYENDGDDENDSVVNRKNRRQSAKPTTKGTSKKTRKQSSATKSRVKKPREPSKKDKKNALRIHAETLRKKRLEELKVRNEELQVHKNEQDQKRAELIAAKFDTNTDELRIKRLEQRLELLHKLDQKRFTILQNDTTAVPLPNKAPILPKPVPRVVTQTKDGADNETTSESSDDEIELEVVEPDAVSFLEFADRPLLRHKKRLQGTTQSNASIKAWTSDKPVRSPGQSLTARAALKSRLLTKQRKMGNLWLARELGYKNEQEHVQDCIEAEKRKRQLMLQREQARILQQEELRKRILVEGVVELEEEEKELTPEGRGGDGGGGDGDDSDQSYKPSGADGADDDDDDEELAMARALKKRETKEGLADKSSSVNDACDRSDAGSDFPDAIDDSDTDPTAPNEDENSQEENQNALETQQPTTSSIVPIRESVQSDESDPQENCSSDNGIVSSKDVINEASNATAEENSGGHQSLNVTTDKEGKEVDGDEKEATVKSKPKGPRNSAWQALLRKEAEVAKKNRKKPGNLLVEEEADEEEDEEIAGLEDFGFTVNKKKKDDEDEDEVKADEINEDDLKHVVDDLSDDEGDEEAGEEARKKLQQQEEKERHKEIMRRMRDGFDGRRGGIAVGGAGARGLHRFDQLVAADNREDAKRLGLLNDDELDSDDENAEKGDGDNVAEEEDEAVLLDKMLKDRFLHRSSAYMEENFSEDEDDAEDQENDDQNGTKELEDVEELEQERLAKRFAKRARMHRLIEAHGHEQEFSQSKLIEEDLALKQELQKMKVCIR